jgi:hypothetical protein
MKEIILSTDKIKNHKQIERISCIPSSIEAVLKLLGKINQDEHPLQLEFLVKEEKRKKEGRHTVDCSDFCGEYYGVRFKPEFFPPKRVDSFPIDSLFKKIESELDKEKYVIISLANDPNFHNWIIYGKTENGDFLAINPGNREKISDVKNRVKKMCGTDIIVYD